MWYYDEVFGWGCMGWLWLSGLSGDFGLSSVVCMKCRWFRMCCSWWCFLCDGLNVFSVCWVVLIVVLVVVSVVLKCVVFGWVNSVDSVLCIVLIVCCYGIVGV